MPRKKQRLCEEALAARWATLDSSDDENAKGIEVPELYPHRRNCLSRKYPGIFSNLDANEPCSSGQNELSTAPSMAPAPNGSLGDEYNGTECDGHEDAVEEVNEPAMDEDAVEEVDEHKRDEDGGGLDGAEEYDDICQDEEDLVDSNEDEDVAEGLTEGPVDNDEALAENQEGAYWFPESSEEDIIDFNWNESDYEESFDRPQGFVPPFQNLLLPHQDIDAGLKLSQKISKLSSNFQLRIMRLLTKYQTINKYFKSDLLKLIASAEGDETQKVPTDYRTLLKSIPLESMSCWISHICFKCKKKVTYKFHVGARDQIKFPECLCGKLIDYNVDHFLVADVAEILALVLPSIWEWRNPKYLPPHIQKVMSDNNMNFETDFTLTVSSDGVNFFKSSALSVWPIMAMIDGIPYHLQRKTILFLGALSARNEGKYFLVNRMLDDFVKQVNRLNQFTFSWMYKGAIVTSRVLVSRVVADSPARAALQGVMNFNGACGCNYCYHFQTGAYYNHFTSTSTPRTDARMRYMSEREDFESLTVARRDGIRWKSSFAPLPFDLVDGFPPDVMHAVYLGAMKLLIEKWISRPGKDKDGRQLADTRYQLSQKQKDDVDQRLRSIRPPDRTQKPPKEITKVGMWKAHELSMFLLYYGPIILQGILRADIYAHYLELVKGISLLSSEITRECVKRAQTHLDKFSEQLGGLYDSKCYRFNVHLLRHLPRFCELHGMLPLFSMYPFESENHRLGSYVHGSNAVVMQIFSKSMQRLILNSHEDTFKRSHRSQGWLEWECPDEPIDSSEFRNLESPRFGDKYYEVYHPPHGRHRIVSKAYKPLKTRNSYTVKLDNDCIASVLKYFNAFPQNKIFAIVEEFEVTKHEFLDHIWYLKKNLGKRMVPVSAFVEQVVEVRCGGRIAFAMYLNNIEHVAE